MYLVLHCIHDSVSAWLSCGLQYNIIVPAVWSDVPIHVMVDLPCCILYYDYVVWKNDSQTRKVYTSSRKGVVGVYITTSAIFHTHTQNIYIYICIYHYPEQYFHNHNRPAKLQFEAWHNEAQLLSNGGTCFMWQNAYFQVQTLLVWWLVLIFYVTISNLSMEWKCELTYLSKMLQN